MWETYTTQPREKFDSLPSLKKRITKVIKVAKFQKQAQPDACRCV